MADPLTVAIGVASLVAAAGKSLQSIQTFRSKYKSSDLSALTLKAQCDCILVALGQIQTTLLSKQRLAARLVSDESVSGQSLKSVLGACEVTFVIMVSKLSKLDRTLESVPNGFSTKDKIARVWNESKINELGQNISRLSDGLNLILTAFNTKSQLETLEVLTSKRASIILENVVDDASSIYISDENASLISRATSFYQEEAEIFSEIGIKDFQFDQEVLMTSAYRKVQQSTNPKPHIAFTAHSAQVETEQNKNSSPIHQASLHQLTAPDIAYKTPELEASSVLLKHEEEGQGADTTTHDSPSQSSFLIDDEDKNKGLLEWSDATSTVEISTLVHNKKGLTIDLKSQNPLSRAARNTQSYPLLASTSKTIGNMNTSSVSENSRGTDKRTLYDFLPLNPMPLKSSAPALQRQKFWITPTEINVIGQNIQDISRHAVDAVHNTLTS
ncbi:MAG: hypothetical protein Q9167_004782 [Letrouitia subvulpina]